MRWFRSPPARSVRSANGFKVPGPRYAGFVHIPSIPGQRTTLVFEGPRLHDNLRMGLADRDGDPLPAFGKVTSGRY
jgi:hypothetical protein